MQQACQCISFPHLGVTELLLSSFEQDPLPYHEVDAVLERERGGRGVGLNKTICLIYVVDILKHV